MSQEVAQAKSNELDIDDGTMPIEDAAQTEGIEETAQIDDDGDVDGSQVSEVETADDATTTDDGAETATEDAPEATDATPKPEGTAAEAPKPEDKPSEWAGYVSQFREEFGETAAKPFEALVAKLEQQNKVIEQLATERQQAEVGKERATVSAHATAAGIPASKHAAVHQDAVDYFMLRQKQGRAIDGMEALKWAIRANGGSDKAPATKTNTTTATAKAEKLQGLRSIPPKSRQPAPDLNLDDPAVADGTAPARASR